MKKKKPTILIVHNYYQIPGGEDTVVANEKQMLESHGHRVILYSRNNLEIKEFNTRQKILLPFITIYNIRTYQEIRKIIKEQRVKMVHIHNTLSLISPSVYYAALSMKVPVVQTIHNFRLLCPGAIFYRNGHICEDCITKGLGYAVWHACYRGSRLQTLAYVISTTIHRMMRIYGKIYYICLTDFNKEKLLKLRQIREDSVFVKPNFVKSISDFVPKAERGEYFIFAGRLDTLKGIDLLLRAWKRMKHLAPKLRICGIGPMEKWCKKFIKKNHLNVEMLGFVSNEEARKLIAYSKGLILPTQWYEGFPMSIVEAFSVGTPVICSDIGNAGSVVIEGVSGCKFKRDSIDELINAIIRLEKMDFIYDSTLKNYYSRYTEDINYKELIYIYRNISKQGS